MTTPCSPGTILALSFACLGADAVSGQGYPNKPIRVVTSAAGGGNDFVARLIAQGIAGPLGQPVIVDNRGSGVIPGEIVSKALADGYTLLVAGGAFTIGYLLQATPYNSLTDFAPITAIDIAPNILVVHPTLPVKSVTELIALARARPGMLNYGAGNTGSANHLGPELFKAMTGVNIVRINYKGSGPAVTALLGGEVQLMISNITGVITHVKSGKLVALAVTSAQPSTLVPGLPTVAASGLHGFEVSTIDAIFAPANTPAAIINRLNQEIVRLLKTREATEKLFNAGTEVVASSPQELAAAMKAEIVRMGKVIKDAGIRAD